MHTVKVISSVVVLTALVVATGIYSYYTLSRSSKNLESHIAQIENSTSSNDWEKAKYELTKVEENWSKIHIKWSMLIDHTELDNIDSTLTRMGKFIETKDTSSALAEAAALKLYIKHIPERESFNLRNII